MTPAKVARIFAACSTPARALRASERVRALGQPALADALYAHAMGLRAVGYPAVQATYRQARDEALSGASVAQ